MNEIYHLPSWRRKWQPTPVLLPGKFHGWGSLVGYSPWGHKESDTIEWHHFLSIVPFGEGNGNPLQCSCLENPMDGGDWWAAAFGVAESDTAKQLTHTHTVQWWFKNFCKGDKSFEGEERSGWPLEVDSDQLRAVIKVDPLIATQEIV